MTDTNTEDIDQSTDNNYHLENSFIADDNERDDIDVENLEDVEENDEIEDIDEVDEVEDDMDDPAEEEIEDDDEQQHDGMFSDLTGRKKSKGDDSEEMNHSASTKVRLAVRKPPSKWVLFLAEQRKSVSDEHPELAMGEVTKFIAAMYKDLPESEHDRLNAVVEEKKKEYEEALAHNRSIDDIEGAPVSDSVQQRGKLLFPLARVKRIIKLDDEVKNVSKESVASIAKATELFVARLAVKAATTARIRGGKTVNMNDLLHTIHSGRSFEFLDLDFPKPSTSEAKSSTKRSSDSSASSSKQAKKPTVDPAVNGKYSMLNFISGTKRSSNENDGDDDGMESNQFEMEMRSELPKSQSSPNRNVSHGATSSESLSW